MTKTFNIDYLKESDAESLCLLMTSNIEIFERFFPKTLSQNLKVGDSRLFISKKIKEIDQKSEYTFAIRNVKIDSIKGLVILKDIDWDDLQGELAYCVDQNANGKGLATSSVQYVSDFAFDKLGLKKLKIIVNKSNLSSIRVAEKAGFHWKKTLHKAYRPPNEKILDMELYELTHER